MKRPPAPGFVLVATRELRWIVRDRIALFLIVGVFLIGAASLSLTFSDAVIRGLNTVIVDADRTPTSLRFVQAVAAAPGIGLNSRANDLSTAMHAIRSGEALAAVYIPENFARDVAAGRRPQISVFYNGQFMTPGNAASRALQDAVQAATAASSNGAKQPRTIGSLVVEQYVLTNPALNYAQFLLRAILPTVLHVIVGISGAYVVGSEFARRSLRTWLRCAGGRPLVALIGKLAPLLSIFIFLMSALVMVIIHGVYRIPFRGDAVMVVSGACLLIVAYLGLATLLALLARNIALGLSLTGIFCSPAFGFAGVGFPTIAMLPFAHGWGAILPLRWYMQILFDQAARGAPVASSSLPFAALAGLAILYGGLAWWRLAALARGLRPPVARRAALPPVAMPANFGAAVIGEVRRVFADRGVMGLMVLAPFLYGALYPQPYVGQLLRHLPIAVVDHDRTEISRRLISTLDADAALQVAVRADTLAEAQTALFGRRVFGIVEIPDGTTRDLLKGDPARLPAYVDSAYFLVYSRTLQGVSESAATLSNALATNDARADGTGKARLAVASPVAILPVPLFNPTGGYASYVVPAAFILILQQTLLIGSAMLAGVAFETGGSVAQAARGTARAVLAQGVAHLLVYTPATLLYLVVLPHVYGYTMAGRLPDLLLFAATVLLATSFMGQAVGAWVRHRETAVVLFIATSLPQFFLVGVSWPVEAIPPVMRFVGQIFPSEHGIDGLVRIDQMGAGLAEVAHDWIGVLVLMLAYFVLAVSSTGIRRWRLAHAG
ncbi:MAG TPA: ABC transporter permease [Methylomirabilota bacterium]|nr:ABC transporter permease [Methylomirabilota bacterium]